MPTPDLPHTNLTQQLLRDGRRATAKKNHNARVAEQLKRAQAGETICLTDLMAAREEIVVDEIGDRPCAS